MSEDSTLTCTICSGEFDIETAQHLFPDVCAHPECEKTPIVGISQRFVCEDHLDWVMIPVRDLLQIVKDNFMEIEK